MGMSIISHLKNMVCVVCIFFISYTYLGGRCGLYRDRMVVTITSTVVSSSPAHGEVYLVQLYVIKFISDLQQADGFL